LRAFCVACCSLILATVSSAQSTDSTYARKNSLGVLTAYSSDSSHIFLGFSENRELLNIGLSYSRRLYLNNVMNWQFDGEILPVALNSDPVQVTTSTVTFTNPPNTFTSTLSTPTVTACHPSSGSGTFGPNGPTYTYVSTCTRRWVMGEGISPIGLQWNFRPRRKLQPVVEGHIGYMYSTRTIPVAAAGSFNFTFDVGAGFELYRSHTRSLRAEYRYHHISNDDTADANPGIDSGLIQLSWVFGR
jgi:opacity protein-like surface antigen